jgi:hypothetical protein
MSTAYRITIYRRGGHARYYDYETLAEAKKAAEKVYQRTSVVLGIEKVSLPRKYLFPAKV